MQSVGCLVIGDEILSGKRQDKHLAHAIATLGARGIGLDYAHYLGDDRAALAAFLRESFARGDLVFSFGGIGATPDDHTRQATAMALGVPLEGHPEALREIEARFGAEAHPHRVRMAEFPQGSRIIPHPYNRIAAFAVHDHCFFPGFPEMAWPMLDWVLEHWYADRARERPIERAVVVHDAGEGQLMALMERVTAEFPQVKLFSLPSFLEGGRRRLELGVRGLARDVAPAFEVLRAGVAASGFAWEPLAR
jgi:molybdopterin-biosynthesis enzyme MoeA-like protein